MFRVRPTWDWNAISRVGPHGYIHGWIKVAGAGEHLRLFHGTAGSSVEAIQREGLRPARGNIGIASLAHTLTTSREEAENYARLRAGGWLEPKVMEFHVPAKDVKRFVFPGDESTEGLALGKGGANWHALRKSLPPSMLAHIHDVSETAERADSAAA